MIEEVGAYLAAIDWVAAVAVGGALMVIAGVLYRFLAASTTEIGTMIPSAGRAAAEAILDARTGLPVDSWVCPSCRSVNTANASRCYNGCGPRAAAPDGLPREDELPEHRALLGAGHNGRRG